MFVVIINAILGVYQESKAEKAIEALQEIAAATSHVIETEKQKLFIPKIWLPAILSFLKPATVCRQIAVLLKVLP